MLQMPPAGVLAAAGKNLGFPGNLAVADLYAAAMAMVNYTTSSAPTAGGLLTINGVSLGSYDFCVKQGAQTISTFTATDWFTSTQDTRCAFVVVNGALTINAGITVIPTVRKLFVVVYCTGNLTLNGTISMNLRGANHSGTGNSGGYTAPGNIRVATGTYSTITNPTIPATGGSGGAGRTTAGVGNAGSTATLGSGGGGGGANQQADTNNPSWGSGAGASGTCFGGGAGGGAFSAFYNAPSGPAQPGGVNGGAGGSPITFTNGGVGNPAGSRGDGTADNGTGGVMIVISGGSVTGSGSLTAAGGTQTGSSQSPAPQSGINGGASGGGIVCLMGKSISGPTLSATGGTAISSGFSPLNGGAGGAGATQQLIIP